MKCNKGFPYKEKKKAKKRTRPVVDRRPHLATLRPLAGWFNKPTIECDDDGFCTPNPKYLNANWLPGTSLSRQDACALIDAYANIAWKDKPGYRMAMFDLVGHFMNLYERQDGRCAISNIPLIGTPGMKFHGVGIDLLRKKCGPVKGNIRLVSCPIAVMRSRYTAHANYSIELPKREMYPTQDITYALVHSLYWYITANAPFKYLPIKVKFRPERDIPRYSDLPPSFVEFHCATGNPRKADYATMEISVYTFLSVHMDQDRLLLDAYKSGQVNRKPYSSVIMLGDPGVIFERAICDEVLLSFSRKTAVTDKYML